MTPWVLSIPERLFTLRGIPPFDRLRDTELALVADVARGRRFAAGEVVVSPVRPLTRLHVVAAGSLLDASGAPVGPVFGVETLLFDRPLVGEYRAGPEGASCLLVGKGNFFTMINECPGFLVDLAEAVRVSR